MRNPGTSPARPPAAQPKANTPPARGSDRGGTQAKREKRDDTPLGRPGPRDRRQSDRSRSRERKSRSTSDTRARSSEQQALQGRKHLPFPSTASAHSAQYRRTSGRRSPPMGPANAETPLSMVMTSHTAPRGTRRGRRRFATPPCRCLSAERIHSNPPMPDLDTSNGGLQHCTTETRAVCSAEGG